MTRLPNAHMANIAEQKLRSYLLSTAHPVGGPKAKFFRRLGYDLHNIESLRESLLTIARTVEPTEIRSTPYGTKYVIDAWLSSPQGRNAMIRTVWIVDVGTESPRFVTAYPQGDGD